MDSRTLIQEAVMIARGKGMTQAQLSQQAGHSQNGQTVSRMLSKGDCRVSTLLAVLDVIGCELVIKED